MPPRNCPAPRRPLLLIALAACMAPPMLHAAPVANNASVISANTAAPALARISADDIEAASYHGGDLPAGQSALTVKVQILLDRSGISPGVVDGWRGGMSESAIKAFQRRAGLPMTGQMTPVVWALLQPFAHDPLTQSYTITTADSEGLVDRIPADYGEKAQMTSQGYTSVQERLAERFHMDEKFLAKLNPGKDFTPGTTITTTVPAKQIRGRVARIIVDKTTRRVAAYDDRGRMLADYPATVGSDQTPSPQGTHMVDAVALNPTYTYNPGRNFKQGDNDRVLVIPPGPNGPVGDVWIDLSKPTYGIHGTATPSRLFVNQSNGCVRLTNWDARELADMVQTGKTIVEFLEPGVSIADVTAPAATSTTAITALQAARPQARPAAILRAENTMGQVMPDQIVAGSDPLSDVLQEALIPHVSPAQSIGPTPPPRRAVPRVAEMPRPDLDDDSVSQTVLPPPDAATPRPADLLDAANAATAVGPALTTLPRPTPDEG